MVVNITLSQCLAAHISYLIWTPTLLHSMPTFWNCAMQNRRSVPLNRKCSALDLYIEAFFMCLKRSHWNRNVTDWLSVKWHQSHHAFLTFSSSVIWIILECAHANALYIFHLLPVSGWHVPCWWQLHGTHDERGPLPGNSRVNPGAHCSQNWPATPRGQEQVSTHGAGGLAGPEETTAEVMVTPPSCDVSREEGSEKMAKAPS